MALVLLVAGELATVALLVRLGGAPPFDLGWKPDAWARATPADALAAALRWVALVAACWLVLVTACGAVDAVSTRRADRRVSTWHRRVDRVARLAPRPVSILLERA